MDGDPVAVPAFGSIHPREIAALKKTTDAVFSYEAGSGENICPGISDEALAKSILNLRDQAVVIARERIAEIDRWDNQAQDHIKRWFSRCDKTIQAYLRDGISACIHVMQNLKIENFVRYQEGLDHRTGCTAPHNADNGTVASVCKSDLEMHIIAIAPRFCSLPKNKVNFDTKCIMLGNSQILTLVHEVTHFDDVFSSSDTWYGSNQSLYQISQTANHHLALKNADSLASYILKITGEPRR